MNEFLLRPSQVISAFSRISNDTGDKGHPDPAASFAVALGATNIDFLQFVPMSCAVSSGIDFYWKMCIRTLAPIGAVLVLCLWPLSCIALRKPYVPAARKAAKLALILLEVMTPSVTTGVIQTFTCDKFDSGWFLRDELTLACDGSARRRKWVAVASVFIVVYPIGVPLLLFGLMYRHRDEINKLQQALKENDSVQADTVSAKRLAMHLSLKQRRPSIVASVQHSLSWIVKKFERFNPGRWYAGVVLLVFRILQTSCLVLISSQHLQVCHFRCLFVFGGLARPLHSKRKLRTLASRAGRHSERDCNPWNVRVARGTTVPEQL